MGLGPKGTRALGTEALGPEGRRSLSPMGQRVDALLRGAGATQHPTGIRRYLLDVMRPPRRTAQGLPSVQTRTDRLVHSYLLLTR